MAAAAGDRPEIQLKGLRGKVRGALLVLQGSTTAELKRAAGFVSALADSCLMVAVDGGIETCRSARRQPDLFVGDGDSATSLPEDVPRILLPRDKDISDLGAALKAAHRRGVHVVLVAGLAGGRMDHEWANLLELGSWSKNFAGILAPTDRGIVILTHKGCRVATVANRTVSLLAPCGRATVSLRGTRWTMQRKHLHPGSLGLSNLTGRRLDLSVHQGVAALMFVPSDRSVSRARRA